MQIFISYAHASIQKVSKIVEVLTAGGHTACFDNQLLPGQDWKKELHEKITSCDAFVFAITNDALASEWCAWELSTAVHLEKVIIPILLEPEVSIPAELKRLQYTDFSQNMPPLEVAKMMHSLNSLQKIPASESPPLPRNPKGLPWALSPVVGELSLPC